MDASLVAFVTSATGATEVERGVRVQSLWGGYGELVRLHLVGGSAPTVILKDVRPPRGERGLSHARKCRSYDVEVAFYRDYAERSSEACRVARPLATRVEGQRWSLLLEDLDAVGFPARRGRSARDLGPCLAWLAAFHARFLGVEPTGLRPVGTYWHLATRPDELARIADPRCARPRRTSIARSPPRDSGRWSTATPSQPTSASPPMVHAWPRSTSSTSAAARA